VEGEDGDDDDEEEIEGADGAAGGWYSGMAELTQQMQRRRRKRRSVGHALPGWCYCAHLALAKKKKAAAVLQSEPPRVGLSKIFKNGVYPVGQEVEYKNE
jgi:methionyl aminopeptidase